MWAGTSRMINKFRLSIGLSKIHLGESGSSLLENVPFAFMWSPSIVPKPDDWGELVDVVGGFYADKPAPNTLEIPEGFDESLTFLDFLDACIDPRESLGSRKVRATIMHYLFVYIECAVFGKFARCIRTQTSHVVPSTLAHHLAQI